MTPSSASGGHIESIVLTKDSRTVVKRGGGVGTTGVLGAAASSITCYLTAMWLQVDTHKTYLVANGMY